MPKLLVCEDRQQLLLVLALHIGEYLCRSVLWQQPEQQHSCLLILYGLEKLRDICIMHVPDSFLYFSELVVVKVLKNGLCFFFYHIIRLLLRYHQLTRTHKVLEAKQHGITVSSSFEIQPVFLHSSSLFCHTLWLLKLEDPKELVLRVIQGRGVQYYWM